MKYQDFQNDRQNFDLIAAYSALALENGCSAEALDRIKQTFDSAVETALEQFRSIEKDSQISAAEPNGYDEICALCEGGNLPQRVDGLREKIAGAVLGRFSGCTLGVPVEGMDIWNMQHMAKDFGMSFPLRQYWTKVERPWGLAFNTDERALFTQSGMRGVPVDDDITYPILCLLIMEKYGKDFTTEDVGEYWKEHLKEACTAELAALNNLKAGVPASQAAERNNPYAQWIGALIRADAFGWVCAGDPHTAAALAYRDAYLTHRRNGIYGEMLFAAVVAASFTVSDPLEAVRIGLREIPTTCALYADVQWALQTAPSVTDYLSARKAVDERFAGMHAVHTNNNACLIVFALKTGGGSHTKTISDTVAMGLDNDCTAATAGSIIGAIVGDKGIDPVWTEGFGDEVRTYIKGSETLSLSGLIDRYVSLYHKFEEK